jgi:two-component system, cell cycle sensor histidine kinase and response regulator CckA
MPYRFLYSKGSKLRRDEVTCERANTLPHALTFIYAREEYMPITVGGETILIVEDDADMLELMYIFLTRHGYKVITAIDGQDGVSKFKEDAGSIKLVVTDMMMPRMNGKQMYDEIRQITPDMKALFNSGYTGTIIEEQGGLGANAEFMEKPLQPAVLLKMVREMLDRPL